MMWGLGWESLGFSARLLRSGQFHACSGPSFVLGNSLLAALPPLFGKYEVSFAVPLFFIQCDRA